VYEKVKDGIKSRVKGLSGIMKFMFETGFKAKSAALKRGYDTPILNMILFNRFGQALGGRVRFMVSGGAAISSSTCEFLHVCFGVPVVQGYGLTETCGASCFLELSSVDILGKSIGVPTLNTEFKLIDVPEMQYTSSDKPCPRGEIWIRGHGVSLGYYNNPQKTAEDFTADGWFKTGDIGQLNENLTFSIIDRKKNLIKPPHGEYIAPERLESVYKNGDHIESIMVYASSDHNELIAFVKPKRDLQTALGAKDQKLKNLSWEALIETKEANKEILDSLGKVWKEAQLKSMERISAVKLFAEEWTAENGWLTAAMKLRRQELHKLHAELIESIYKNLS